MLQVVICIIEQFEELCCFLCCEAGGSGIILVPVVFARKLPVVHFDYYLGCAKTKSEDLEQVVHASTDYGAEGRIIEP